MNVIEVVDVPQDASEDEARRLLNVPCEVNRYMLVQMFPLPNGGIRAFYRLVSSAYDKTPGERNRLRTNTDSNNDSAVDVIRNNAALTVKKNWWTDRRIEALGSGSKHVGG
jgi:hypothetical protein